MNADHTSEEGLLLELTQRLLDCIPAGDWETYTGLCDPTLSAFEPEARRQLVHGMEFHRFYFDLQRDDAPVNTTMTAPHIRWLGEDVAVVSYVRLIQTIDDHRKPCTHAFEETRVWHRQAAGDWKHVHFHRSANT